MNTSTAQLLLTLVAVAVALLAVCVAYLRGLRALLWEMRLDIHDVYFRLDTLADERDAWDELLTEPKQEPML